MKNVPLNILGPFCIILLCLIVLFYTNSVKNGQTVHFDASAFQPNPDSGRSGGNLADIFMRPGQKYNVYDGTIYHCLSGKEFLKVPKPGRIQDFTNTVDPKSNSQDVNAKRQEAFQNKFHPEHPQRMSSEHKVSGIGSTLKAGQSPLALLNTVIERLKIHLNKPVITMVDIPCGDFFWMRELVIQREDVHYTGVDIIPTLIERHNKNYGRLKNAEFKNIDIAANPLDKSYDIVFSRDMLQHLSTVDAMKALEHFSSSGSKILVTTNHNCTYNADTHSAGYRSLNLTLTPMLLVPPICEIPDTVSNNVKHLAVWTLPLKQTK